jgi:hypothetical protein
VGTSGSLAWGGLALPVVMVSTFKNDDGIVSAVGSTFKISFIEFIASFSSATPKRETGYRSVSRCVGPSEAHFATFKGNFNEK